MKRQDIFLLLKFVSIEDDPCEGSINQSARGLAALTGLGKTEVNASIHRSIDVMLARRKDARGRISVNRKALYEFIVYGLKYVFPAKPAELTRGVPTAFAAPILTNKILTAGEIVPVWPDPKADTMGQAVKPLYPTVTAAIAKDRKLYDLLALVDAVRIGGARESENASSKLYTLMKV